MIKIYESAITPESGVYSALSDDDYQINRCQILQVRGDDTRGVVTINAVFYLEEADLITGTMFTLGFIDEEIVRPNSYTMVNGVEIIQSSFFHNGAGSAFAGTQVLDKISVTISPTGAVFVWVNTVTTPSTLGGTDYVIIPINITYTKIFPIVAI